MTAARHSTGSLSSPRVRQKHGRRRREILQAALRAFRRHGFHATTLADIAAQLDMRNTALYHYFPDKEAILYACHHEALEDVERLLAEALRRHASAPDRLHHIIREHVRVMTATLEGSPLALDTTSLTPSHTAEIIARRDRYEGRVRAVIEQGIADGVFRPVDAKVAAFVIFGAINWIARWYRPGGSHDPEQLSVRFADYLTGGLTCR